MSLARRLYRGEASFDFGRAWKVGMVLSTLVILTSIASLTTRGLNLGIEFEGGTSFEFEAAAPVDVEDVRDVMGDFGQSSAKIQGVGDSTVRVKADIEDPEAVSEVADALAELGGVDSAAVSITVVGPSWGDEITEAAQRALIWFVILIFLYIAIRLEWKMAVGALVATVHDIIVVVGVYSIFQFEVTPATVIAFLTILGYSLYDTIVVYDRARENAARYAATGKYTYRDVMNISLNQVLMRSINTTITSLLPIISMLVVGSVALGAAPLQEFAIALLVGLIVGGYSSLFVAAPLVMLLKQREPKWSEAQERQDTAGTSVEKPTVASARTAPVADTAGPYSHPPRPRKGRKRK